jgi:hypothetical protein
MDAQRQQTLWALALENSHAAVFTAQQGWHNVSVTRSYYAVFLAMWVALDDPPQGRWKHGGIIDRFVYGQWRTPPMPLAREQTRALRQLYLDRVDADYGGVYVSMRESTASLATARQIFALVAQTLGLLSEGMLL